MDALTSLIGFSTGADADMHREPETYGDIMLSVQANGLWTDDDWRRSQSEARRPDQVRVEPVPDLSVELPWRVREDQEILDVLEELSVQVEEAERRADEKDYR